MAKENPRNLPNVETITFVDSTFSIDDTVSVKDSAIYQFQKWKYLVKKQFGNLGENDLLNLLDELTHQGWELISCQPVNLGFYIFKKPAQ